MSKEAEIKISDGVEVPALMLSSQAFLAGWIAGGAGIAVGHPFDTIKTLQQTQTTSKTSISGYKMLKDIWTGHGVRGLYRGLSYPLVTYGAVNAAFFAGAEYTRNFMFLKGLGDDMGKLTYTQIFLVGCAGGVAQIPVVVPSELIKIKLQNQLITGQKLYSGPIDCTLKLYRKYGFAHGYYRGIWSTIYRDIYAWGFYLLAFEWIRDKLSNYGCHYIVSELIAGGFAGVAGWVTATPFDVVKSRIQASEGKVKIVPVIKELYREEGLKAFTRGMAVSGLRGFPSNAVTLFGFAELMRWFNRANKDYYG